MFRFIWSTLIITLITSSGYAFSLNMGRVGNFLKSLTSSFKRKDPLNDIYCSSFVNSYSLDVAGVIFSNESEEQKFINLLKLEPMLPIPIEEKIGSLIVERNPLILNRGKYKKLYKYFDKECRKVLDLAGKLAKKEGKKLPYSFKFYIYDGLEKNAMSLPGGFILVSKDIVLDAFKFGGDKETFLEFTLAHEIAHNTNRHYTLLLQRNLIMAYNDTKDITRLISFFKAFMKEGNRNEQEIFNFVDFVAQGLEKIKKKNLHEINQYSNVEKEADACAVRELSYEFHDLKRLPEIVVSNLPQVRDYSNMENNQNNSESLINKMVNLSKNLRIISEFYFSQHLDIHPSSKERYEFLKKITTKLQRSN